MGLERSQGKSVTYIGINNGMFTNRATENTPGAVKRTIAKGTYAGKVIYEQQNDKLRGKITKLDHIIKDINGKKIEYVEVNIVDDKTYVLQIPWQSSLKSRFIAQLPNVDYNIPVLLSVFKGNDDKTALLIYQNDKFVGYAHTRKNPNGMPEAIETIVRGEKKLDFTVVENFLYNVLQEQKNKLLIKETESLIDNKEDKMFTGPDQDENCPF